MFVNNNQNTFSEKELNENRFPTNGLKTLLKNSELLEVLLKPLSKNDQNDAENKLTKDVQLDLNLNFSDEPKSFLEWDDPDDFSEIKSIKTNCDLDGTKSYGNAFLGQNLWDKNDLFQSEKFGVKFESLEIDEFLNENGLNETDVEFLDHLQKYESLDSPSITNSIDSSSLNGQKCKSTSSLSPVSSITSPINNIQQKDKNSINSNLSVLDKPSLSNSIASNYQKKQINKTNEINKEVSTGESMAFDSFKSSYDWDINLNESTMDSISEYEFDSKSSKVYENNLKQQTIIRKSKKFVPNELKDEKYWARRRKNNLAAKRSRDARRMKENQIAMRASYLEKENDNLRKQLEDFKRETKLLKAKLAHYESDNQNVK